jgi:hypothetical protein
MMAIRSKLQNLLGPAMRATAEIAAEPLVKTGGKIPLIINLENRCEPGDDAELSEALDRSDATGKEKVMEPTHEMNRVTQ